MEVALDGWGGEWVECGSGDVARKGCAMEKCRLYLLRFVHEFEKSFLFFSWRLGFLSKAVLLPAPLASIEALPAPRSLAGAPSPTP